MARNRSEHIEAVGTAYEATKEKLHLLLSDLAPIEWSANEAVNKQIEFVYAGIQQLRDLACTYPITSPVDERNNY